MNNGARTKIECGEESNTLFLTSGDWIIVIVIIASVTLLLPRIWILIEGFHPDNNYRIADVLSEDYWHFNQYAQFTAKQPGISVLGDSVVWGKYVSVNETLSYQLSRKSNIRFYNLGINGMHPVAMKGLIKHYGKSLREKSVMLHFNPLWMSSPRHDLSGHREFKFNHPTLVPQFYPPIPCYHENINKKTGIALSHYLPLQDFAGHLAIVYYESKTLPRWVLEYPYNSPLKPLLKPYSYSTTDDFTEFQTWMEQGMTPRAFEWISPENSFQWRFFINEASHLRDLGNTVFLLIGPFNIHAIEEQNKKIYAEMLAAIESRLRNENFLYHIATPLPSAFYADASHPNNQGYAQIVSDLQENESFLFFVDHHKSSGINAYSSPRRSQD